MLGSEGIDLLAVTMPRTNSEMLQVEGVNANFINAYGARIMQILRPFWDQVDKREHDQILQNVSRS